MFYSLLEIVIENNKLLFYCLLCAIIYKHKNKAGTFLFYYEYKQFTSVGNDVQSLKCAQDEHE